MSEKENRLVQMAKDVVRDVAEPYDPRKTAQALIADLYFDVDRLMCEAMDASIAASDLRAKKPTVLRERQIKQFDAIGDAAHDRIGVLQHRIAVLSELYAVHTCGDFPE